MRDKLMLILIFLSFSIFNCNTTEPPENGSNITLTVEEVSCTEAWVRLTTINIQLPAEINLIRTDAEGHSLSQVSLLNTQDSLLYIDSLLPNKTYNFQAVMQSNLIPMTSDKLPVTTLDTTSHNYTWQTFTFGEHSSSVLYDVAIINENNIWAVGEIYLNDSTGQPDPHAYNAVHWDGEKWEVMRVYFPTVCGSSSLTSYPARAIFAFDDGQIWISSTGDKIVKIKNDVQIDKFCLPSNVSMSINKIWGTSSENLYIVGDNGNIAHYDGNNWQKIENETELPVNDIWGYEDEIAAVASDKYYNRGKKVLEINNEIKVVPDDGLPWSISAIWFNKHKYYIVGDGIYVRNNPGEKWINITGGITSYYTHSISGNGLNDIFISGSAGDIAHFNGITWEDYLDKKISSFYGNLYGIMAKDDIVCAVGSGHINGHQAVIIFGKR